MPKRSRNNNSGCCLVSLFLWPFQLLEQAINSFGGQQPSSASPNPGQPARRSVQRTQRSMLDRFTDVSPAQPPGAYQPRISVSISYENRGTTFAKQALKFRNKEGGIVSHVPFKFYWPTYEDMDKAQKSWYLRRVSGITYRQI